MNELNSHTIEALLKKLDKEDHYFGLGMAETLENCHTEEERDNAIQSASNRQRKTATIRSWLIELFIDFCRAEGREIPKPPQQKKQRSTDIHCVCEVCKERKRQLEAEEAAEAEKEVQ